MGIDRIALLGLAVVPGALGAWILVLGQEVPTCGQEVPMLGQNVPTVRLAQETA